MKWCWLQLLASASDWPRVLLFWPVDSSKRTVAQVKKNFEHAKASLGPHCCDVYLAHYKGDSRAFGAWYRQHVVGNLTGSGFKFKFMQEAYKRAQFEEPWERRYDYVWGLDSDVDLTKTNLTKLFEMAKKSNAFIVGPTFVGSGVNGLHPGGDLKKKHLVRRQVNHRGQAALVRQEALDLSDGSSHGGSGIWRFERPDPSCDYRHTDFVELTAPILTMDALPMIFNDCSSCIHEKSDWGLDMVWCNFLSSEAQQSSSCALVDAAPVNHLNWKQALPSKVFYEANREVHRKYRRFWAHFKTFSCVVVEPAIAMNGLQDLELPGHQHLVRQIKGRDESR